MGRSVTVALATPPTTGTASSSVVPRLNSIEPVASLGLTAALRTTLAPRTAVPDGDTANVVDVAFAPVDVDSLTEITMRGEAEARKDFALVGRKNACTCRLPLARPTVVRVAAPDTTATGSPS